MKGHLQPKPLRQSFGWWLWWRAVVNELLNPQAAYLVGVVCLVDTDAKKPCMINFDQISSNFIKTFPETHQFCGVKFVEPFFLER